MKPPLLVGGLCSCTGMYSVSTTVQVASHVHIRMYQTMTVPLMGRLCSSLPAPFWAGFPTSVGRCRPNPQESLLLRPSSRCASRLRVYSVASPTAASLMQGTPSTTFFFSIFCLLPSASKSVWASSYVSEVPLQLCSLYSACTCACRKPSPFPATACDLVSNK